MNIRQATINDVDNIAFINYTSWQETYRGVIEDSFLDAMNIEQLKTKWNSIFTSAYGAKFIFAMETDKKEVVAYCCAGKASKQEYNFDAEIYALYLLKKDHNKGWGKALFNYSMNELKASGFKSCCLFVLKDNPFLNFYRSFNPHFEQLLKVKIGEKEYDEILLGWSNLENFNLQEST